MAEFLDPMAQVEAWEQIPPVSELSGKSALYYVASMLESLILTYEQLKAGPHADKMSNARKPSYSEATMEASLVASALGIRTITGDDDIVLDSAIIDDTDDQPHTDPGQSSPQNHIREGSDGDMDARIALHSRFWLKEVPHISVLDYLLRFHKYCRSSTATYLAAGRYIFLVCMEQKKLPLTRLNVYRLFCSAYVVAAKLVEDMLYPYKRYATTGGLSPAELGKLEISFLFLVDFETKIDYELLTESLATWSRCSASLIMPPDASDGSGSQPSTPQLAALQSPPMRHYEGASVI